MDKKEFENHEDSFRDLVVGCDNTQTQIVDRVLGDNRDLISMSDLSAETIRDMSPSEFFRLSVVMEKEQLSITYPDHKKSLQRVIADAQKLTEELPEVLGEDFPAPIRDLVERSDRPITSILESEYSDEFFDLVSGDFREDISRLFLLESGELDALLTTSDEVYQAEEEAEIKHGLNQDRDSIFYAINKSASSVTIDRLVSEGVLSEGHRLSSISARHDPETDQSWVYLGYEGQGQFTDEEGTSRVTKQYTEIGGRLYQSHIATNTKYNFDGTSHTTHIEPDVASPDEEKFVRKLVQSHSQTYRELEQMDTEDLRRFVLDQSMKW